MRKTAFILALLFLCGISVTAFAEADNDYQEGLRHYNAGNFEEAVKYLKRYSEKKPKASVSYLIGYSLYKLGRHDEAMQYFRDSYLLTPEYSPIPEQERPMEKGTLVIPEMPSAVPAVPEYEMEPEEEPLVEPAPQVPLVMPEEPMIVEPEEAVPEELPEAKEEEVVPEKEPQREITLPPPVGLPKGMEMPQIPKGMMAVAGIAGLMSGVVGLLINIGLYIFTALCLFRIGKKLDVSNSWIAWIPILNGFWPLVGAAGRTVKWGLMYLLVLPILAGIIGAVFATISPFMAILVLGIVGLVVFGLYISLWMSTSENLGKEKLLGLLMIVPVVNLIFMGYLAFSESS
jgi:hypothetical protein